MSEDAPGFQPPRQPAVSGQPPAADPALLPPKLPPVMPSVSDLFVEPPTPPAPPMFGGDVPSAPHESRSAVPPPMKPATATHVTSSGLIRRHPLAAKKRPRRELEGLRVSTLIYCLVGFSLVLVVGYRLYQRFAPIDVRPAPQPRRESPPPAASGPKSAPPPATVRKQESVSPRVVAPPEPVRTAPPVTVPAVVRDNSAPPANPSAPPP